MAKKDTTAYDHPHFTISRESRMAAVQGPASAVDFAHFRSRNKVLLRAIHVNLRSAASGTAGSLHYTRSAATLASKTISSASVGYSAVLTLTTNNTLHTISEVAAIRITGAADKGKWDVLYEYDILYPSTHLGQ
jgi:hypothetical protein|tara:strand:+ start:1652 stop:2053 length:402 start_codon:yes stop_codon:yes gene_type:complete